MKLGQKNTWEVIQPLLPSMTWTVAAMMIVLMLLVWCERALGLPVWSVVAGLYVTSGARWPEKGWWLVGLSVLLALAYGQAVAPTLLFATLVTAGSAYSAEKVKSDTIRTVVGSLVALGLFSWQVGFSWTPSSVGVFALSFAAAVVVLRYVLVHRGRVRPGAWTVSRSWSAWFGRFRS